MDGRPDTSTAISGTRWRRSSGIPLSHNLEWHAVLSLLEARHGARDAQGPLVVTIGGRDRDLRARPGDKDIDAETGDPAEAPAAAGYEPQTADAA